MDKVREDATITDSQITVLNYYWLYLDVDLLSDITTGDGKRLVTEAITQQGKQWHIPHKKIVFPYNREELTEKGGIYGMQHSNKLSASEVP
eukprot:14842-Ditylum_brightwellii.AAC.1